MDQVVRSNCMVRCGIFFSNFRNHKKIFFVGYPKCSITSLISSFYLSNTCTLEAFHDFGYWQLYACHITRNSVKSHFILYDVKCPNLADSCEGCWHKADVFVFCYSLDDVTRTTKFLTKWKHELQDYILKKPLVWLGISEKPVDKLKCVNGYAMARKKSPEFLYKFRNLYNVSLMTELSILSERDVRDLFHMITDLST
ncbi:hypothetical protein CEXT_140881 [Caerostris extrusa]|uniref:Uncharacterized protein n=1 Tax=Caerostris extrusa TaxID=172846 RepID=A0AAV4R741_CAEEX|nr:hypothetical protein CEXT_140881 [Caerostris extrusa]